MNKLVQVKERIYDLWKRCLRPPCFMCKGTGTWMVRAGHPPMMIICPACKGKKCIEPEEGDEQRTN